MDTQILSPQPSSPTITHNFQQHCKSPEFEFWMVRNPCFPQPNLLPADQLISHGVLLPLHHLSLQTPPPPQPDPETGPGPSPSIASPSPALSASKRWRDLFKRSEKKSAEIGNQDEKGKKKERKNNGSGGGGSAELNINIWPFSRSRSAGTRPRLFAGAPVTRRVNSAPCSRSNSAGESKSRKWPSSPGRAGVHLGRSSPVWQVPRPKIHDPKETTAVTRRSKVAAGGGKNRVLSLNVPTCIGYKQHLSCGSDVNSAAVSVAGGATVRTTRGRRSRNGGASGGAGNGGNLFSFRSIFSKKSVVTSH